MKRRPNVPREVQHLLQQIQHASTAYDQKLYELRQSITIDSEEAEEWYDYIEDIGTRRLLHCKEQAANVAGSVQVSARHAEESSRSVKNLDGIRSKVHAVSDVVNGIIQQKESVALVATAIEQRNYEDAAKYVKQFDAVAKKIPGLKMESLLSKNENEKTSNGEEENDESSFETISSTDIIESAKKSLYDAVSAELDHLTSKEATLRFSKILADLGFVERGTSVYCEHVVQQTSKELHQMVEQQLKEIEFETGKTHLTLVSQALDHVVATLEREESFAAENFGSKGLARLTEDLHHQCTDYSGTVLSDFLRKRKPQQTDPRQMDQILEEISHLITCCNLYMSFMESKLQKGESAAEVEFPWKKDAHPLHGKTQKPAFGQKPSPQLKNSLESKVEELFTYYEKLQREYFTRAFRETLDFAQKTWDQSNAGVSAIGKEGKDATSIMGTLTALYSGTPLSPSAGGHHASPKQKPIRNNDDDTPVVGEVEIVDDCFYLIRVALNRSAQTRSLRLCEVTIDDIIYLMEVLLLPEVHQRINFRSASISPSVLKWMNAAACCYEYLEKLRMELVMVADTTFTSQESLLSLKKSSQKFERLSLKTKEELTKQLKQAAQAVLLSLNLFHKFEPISYEMGEKGFNQADLNDPWAVGSAQELGLLLDAYKLHLHEGANEELVGHVVSVFVDVVFSIIMKKRFDAFGALQLDKDIRHFRQFFSGRTESPIRDKFFRLTCVTSILLVDRPHEALEVFQGFKNTPLNGQPITAKEAKAMLMLRGDYSKESIQSLNFG